MTSSQFTTMQSSPRRSVLFMPIVNSRAVAKATGLDVDSIILDLEDSVLPEQKAAARDSLPGIFNTHDFGGREVLVRINEHGSDAWQADMATVMSTPAQGIVIPKIESASQVLDIASTQRRIASETGQDTKPLWVMIETPQGVLSAQQICAADPLLTAVLVGTADLGKDMRVPERADRAGLLASLSHIVLAGRAAGLSVIDGVFMDIRDEAGLRAECEQGVALGFDGKSLIHPAQLSASNEAFAPSASEIASARQMLAAWQDSVASGSGVCVVDDRLVEHLHVVRAQEIVELAKQIGLLQD